MKSMILLEMKCPQLSKLSNALIILQDRGYLRRNIKNTSNWETVSVHFTFS